MCEIWEDFPPFDEIRHYNVETIDSVIQISERRSRITINRNQTVE